jgi:hypothetical protein
MVDHIEPATQNQVHTVCGDGSQARRTVREKTEDERMAAWRCHEVQRDRMGREYEETKAILDVPSWCACAGTMRQRIDVAELYRDALKMLRKDRMMFRRCRCCRSAR